MSKFFRTSFGLLLFVLVTSIALAGAGGLRKVIDTAAVLRDAAFYRDLAYVSNGHERQRLDLFVPANAATPPLIILVHGGAFRAGSKENMRPAPFLRHGYAVASINYRLSGDALWPAQIEDCKAAVRWLRAHAKEYGYDPERIGAHGTSAGGHLVAMLGSTSADMKFDVGENLDVSSRVQAVADFFGPTDFLQMDAHRIPTGQVHDGPDSPESLLIGGSIQENKEKSTSANPIAYVSKESPPFLIVHGDMDPLVPWHQSQLLFDALAGTGVPVTFYTVGGGGHGGFRDPHVEALMLEFFAKHLKRGRE
ncbi:MAG: alpha/beta hydrolase [Candidatus Hydrogenedentes bacterium]|nr:alpha/beta hydrolase [Candidatus Hydrogenedentota bacterium]